MNFTIFTDRCAVRLATSLLAVLGLSSASPVLAANPVTNPEVQPDERTPYFTLSSYRSVGDRGEIHLDVNLTDPACGEQWRFHAAEIDIKANRFGDAQFAALPTPGCTECSEIVVRWMHEPTGHIEFDVNVFRERHMESCEEKIQ